MAENLVVNGTTFNGVDSVSMTNDNGEKVAFYPDAVRYNPQELTEEQKTQARANIGIPEGSGATPDWNAAEGEPGHVLNRTHYVETVTTDIVPKKNVPLVYNSSFKAFAHIEAGIWQLVVGETYKVTFAGTEYECVAFEITFSSFPAIAIGNRALSDGTNNTGEPFIAAVLPDMSMSAVFTTAEGEYEFGIVGEAEIVHPLADKFIQTEYKLSLADGSCDKTWAEIVAALNAGKTLVSESLSISSTGVKTVTRLQMSFCRYWAGGGSVVLQGAYGYRNAETQNQNAIDQVGYIIQAYNGEITDVIYFKNEFDPDDVQLPAYYVEIVNDPNTGGYTTDETVANLNAVYNSGRVIYARIDGVVILQCISIIGNGSIAMFGGLMEEGAATFTLARSGNGYVVEYVKKDRFANPYALTINGMAYDGSKAVEMNITGGGGEDIPDYVRTEAERVAAVVQSRQNANTITAILSSDYHLPNPSHAWYKQILDGITHAGQAMGILRNQINIDFEAKLGDLIYDLDETQEEALASFRMVHSLVSDGMTADRFEANGNHDHLPSNATPFTHAQVYANNGIYNKGCVRDPANRVGGYCYRDYEEFKLRVILLNTGEANDTSFTVSSKQVAWLENALAVPTAEGWGTLILSHHPLDWGGSNTAVMDKIKVASGIIANLHGHVHTYTQDVITGTNIPRLAIPNACFYRNNEYGTNGGAENSEGIEFGTTTTYSKTAGTANDTAFCVLTLDRDAGKLYLDRYGAGIDREAVVLTWTKKATNMLEKAQAVDSTAIYNGGKGYKDKYYLSSTASPYEGDDETTFVTGYIPYVVEAKGVPGTIYIKGAAWTANSHCRLFFFDESKSNPTPQISGTGSGNNSIDTYYTKEVENGVTKLTPIANSSGNWVGISKVAALTEARFFRLSMEGTGANLFVTVDEPIE